VLIDYNKFEIINLQGYQIDHISNKKLLATLQDFYKIAINSKLNYYLAGSVCVSLLTNKIYRTWGDLDVIIEKDCMFEWLELFPKDSWFYSFFDKNLMKLYNYNNSNYIELNTGDHRMSSYLKDNLKVIDYKGLKIGNLNTIYFWKKYMRGSKKDLNDEIIFNEYLNK
jgi:hypothetical protein